MAARWETTLAEVTSAEQALVADIEQRDRLAAAQASTSKLTRSIKTGSRSLKTKLNALKALLTDMQSSPSTYGVNQKQLDAMSGEYQTRERSMESLKIAAQNPGMAERSALLAGSAHGAAASAGGGGGETQRSRDMTNQQMMAQFEKDQVDQDAILDEIGQGVDRIGVLGQHIGDETDRHQMLLDDIEDSMDTAHGKLRQENKHIHKVAVKTKFCWLYVVICLLFVVLAGLVIERWG